jgi:hypothetical protein
MSDYTTIGGIVQFDPRTRQAGDKQVRDVVIRDMSSKKNFSVTIWPEKGAIPVNKGDFLVVDGKYSASVGQNKAGEQVTYHNISATAIVRVAGDPAPSSMQADTSVPAAAAVTGGDEFPF